VVARHYLLFVIPGPTRLRRGGTWNRFIFTLRLDTWVMTQMIVRLRLDTWVMTLIVAILGPERSRA
jgi:hypothetical protein